MLHTIKCSTVIFKLPGKYSWKGKRWYRLRVVNFGVDCCRFLRNKDHFCVLVCSSDFHVLRSIRSSGRDFLKKTNDIWNSGYWHSGVLVNSEQLKCEMPFISDIWPANLYILYTYRTFHPASFFVCASFYYPKIVHLFLKPFFFAVENITCDVSIPLISIKITRSGLFPGFLERWIIS